MTERISWYVMRTVLGKEQEACALVEKKIDQSLWECCRSSSCSEHREDICFAEKRCSQAIFL